MSTAARRGRGSTVARLRDFPRQFWLLIGGTFLYLVGYDLGYPFETVYLHNHLGVSMTSVGLIIGLPILACLPVQIAGRNQVWRDLIMDAIRTDPQWQEGEYKSEPLGALRSAAGMLLIAGSAPIQMQMALPTRDAADEFLQKYMERELADLDANDLLYQVNASRDYDPSAGLEKILAPVMWINSGDDFINPPELGLAEREIKRVKNGHFVLLPASDQTHGHGTHSWAAVWQQYLKQLLDSSQP